MPCAFHAKRPYPFRKLGPGCQFAEDPDHPLVDSGGAQWCRFHLPLDAPDADGVRKADWDETAVAAFNDAVFAHIDAAKAAGEVADLTGVVFPGGIAFDRYRGEEAALPAICFIEAHFGATPISARPISAAPPISASAAPPISARPVSAAPPISARPISARSISAAPPISARPISAATPISASPNSAAPPISARTISAATPISREQPRMGGPASGARRWRSRAGRAMRGKP